MPRPRSGKAVTSTERSRRYRTRMHKRVADLEAEVVRLRLEQTAGEPDVAEAVRQSLDYAARHAGFLSALNDAALR